MAFEYFSCHALLLAFGEGLRDQDEHKRLGTQLAGCLGTIDRSGQIWDSRFLVGQIADFNSEGIGRSGLYDVGSAS